MSYDPPDDGWHELVPDGDGTFTITEPGVYGVTLASGQRVPHFRAREGFQGAAKVRITRELPKDAPIGPPEKWVGMNRKARREAKRFRPK